MKKRILATVAALALVGAACGDAEVAEEDLDLTTTTAVITETTEAVTDTTEAVTDTTEAVTDTTEADAAEQPTLSEFLEENPEEFETLALALNAAGLSEQLEDQELTVFAPGREAFEALDPAELQTFIDDPDQLADLAEFHVVEGILPPEELAETEAVTTLGGSELTIEGSGEDLVVDGVEVIDIVETENAVIYVIDQVLMPE